MEQIDDHPERQVNPLTLAEYFGALTLVALDATLRGNAQTLITRVNRVLREFGQYRRIVSGFEPTIVAVEREGDGGAPAAPRWPVILQRTRHQTAEAVDLADPESDLDQWLLDNKPIMEAVGLWMEHPAATRGHAHVQSVPPLGGHRGRVFYP